MLPSTVGDPAELRAEHLERWREASRRAVRAYDAWCAADRLDRHRLYVSYVDALRREEQAAAQLARNRAG